jgi:YD repeat-containing protein
VLALNIQPQANASTVTYSYDAQGRLILAVFPAGNCTGYQYDAAGNRTAYASTSSTAPTAGNLSFVSYQNLAVSFDPRLSDVSCSALTVTAVGTPSHGSASILSGGVGVTYTPTTGYTGADSFSYTVSNGQTASANVSLTVTAPTLPPVATPGLWSAVYYITQGQQVQPIVTQSIAPITSDPYGYGLTVSAVTQGAHGAVTYSGQNITYTYPSEVSGNKNIADSFSYTVTDGLGHTSSATSLVSITVSTNQ